MISSAETDRVAQVVGQINREYVRLVGSEKLSVTQDDLTLTAGNFVVALPADLLEIITIRQGDLTWMPVTRQTLAEVAEGPSDGEVAVYAMEPPDSIRLPHEIEENGTAKIDYVVRPALLTSGSHVPAEVPVEYHDLIAELVIYRIAMSEEDGNLSNGALAAATSMRQELRAYLGRRGGLGRSTIAVRGLVS